MSTKQVILIVDDNVDNRDLLARLLTKQGYEHVMAQNGREALDLLKSKVCDLILLDIMMPVLGGIDTLRIIKQDENLRNIPVVVVSAIDDTDNVVACIELGAEDFLFKPVNKVILNARVSASLEKKRLRDQEQSYIEHVRQELELGRQIQADFLPATLPSPTGWEIAKSFHPAFEVAGDFYDAFILDKNKLCVVIADVCGKGVGAALFMSLVRSLLRAFSEQASPDSHAILKSAALTNSYIFSHHRQKKQYMFATLFFGVIDTTSGVIDYISAGHYPPHILSQNGTIRHLENCGPALGIIIDADFIIKQDTLLPGDLLFAYTDGIIEARNLQEDLFGAKRLAEILENHTGSAQLLLVAIEQALRTFTANAEPSDDITMLAVKREHEEC